KSLVARHRRRNGTGLWLAVVKIRSRTEGELVEKPNRNLVRALRIGQRQQHRIIGWLCSQCAVYVVQPLRQLDVAIVAAQRVVVNDVVAASHEGIYRAQRIALPSRKDHKPVIEILGGGARDAPTDGVRHIELGSGRSKLHRRISHGGAHRSFSRGFPSSFPSAARATKASLRALEIAGRR